MVVMAFQVAAVAHKLPRVYKQTQQAMVVLV
jgi:hypothetical protein